MKKNKSAFSLIELSVVILIIGILVLGITKGSRIIDESRIKTAQNLTASSPIVSMSGLLLWLDATDSKTIATGTAGSGVYTDSLTDGDSVTDWKDRNPQDSNFLAFSAPADTNRPTYVKKGIGGLPDIKFDGTDDYLRYVSSNGLVTPGKKIYTIVIVFQKTSSANAYMFSQGNGCNNGNVGIEAAASSVRSIGCGGMSDVGSGLPALINTPYSAVIRVNQNLASNTTKIYVNKSSATNDPAGTFDLTAGNVAIGSRYDGSQFSAIHISEIIVFNRPLSDNEILSIQDYISRKYNIKM